MIRQFQRPLGIAAEIRGRIQSGELADRKTGSFDQGDHTALGRRHGDSFQGVSDAEGRRACPYPPRRGHRGGWNQLIADEAAPGLETPKQH